MTQIRKNVRQLLAHRRCKQAGIDYWERFFDGLPKSGFDALTPLGDKCNLFQLTKFGLCFISLPVIVFINTSEFCILGSGNIRMKSHQQYKISKVSLDTVVESVHYKDSSRKAYRRRVIDQTADAAELVRRTGEATTIYVDKMPTTVNRIPKVRRVLK